MIRFQVTCSKIEEEGGRSGDTTFRLEANLPPELANEVVALVMQRLAVANQRAPVGQEPQERGVL